MANADCEHPVWYRVPRGPGLAPWYVCDGCGHSVGEFEWDLLHAAHNEQAPDELRGQAVITWGED